MKEIKNIFSLPMLFIMVSFFLVDLPSANASKVTSETASIIRAVGSVSLPLTRSSMRRFKKLDKRAKSLIRAYKYNSSRELDVINLHAERFEINLILAFNHIKTKKWGYRVRAAKDMLDAGVQVAHVSRIFFKYRKQRYRVVWRNVGSSYRKIRKAYGKEIYDTIRGIAKVWKALVKIERILNN